MTDFEFEIPADAPQPFQQVNPPTTEEVDAARRQVKGERPSLGKALGAAYELESSVAALNRMAELNLDDDPGFVLSEPLLKELTKDVPAEYHENFVEARSEKHARQIREQILTETANNETLAARGWQGIGLQMGVALTDPIALGVTAVTGGAFGALSKAGRLRRALQAGAVAGAENAAIETLITSASQTRGPEDVLYAGLGGFILGGGIAAALPRATNERALALADEVAGELDRQVLAKAGAPIPPAAVKPALDVSDPAIERLAADLDAADEELRNAGAAQVASPPSDPVVDNAFTKEQLDAPRTAFGGARIDIVGRLKSSPIGPVRWLAGKLAEDGVGNADKSIPTEIGASEIASNLRARWETQFYRTVDGAFKDWLRENNLPWTARYTQRDAFFQQVSAAIRGESAESAAIKAAASKSREIFADVLAKAKEAGVFGFENVEANPRYLTRLFSPTQIRTFDARYGESVVKLLSGAIRRATDTDDELATKVAKGYWQKLRRYGAGLDTHIARSLSPDAQDVLREVLEDSQLPDADIARIMDAITPSKETQPITRARKRTLLDESFAMRLYNNETGTTEVVKVSDLFENNAETIMATYLTQLSGHIALAQKGFKSRREFMRQLEQIQAYASHRGIPLRAIDAQVGALRKLYDYLTGAPLEADPMSALAQAGRLVRDTNFVRVMNQTGAAQAAEFGNILSFGGVRAMLAHLPEFRQMLSRAKTGELADDELADELETWVALGTDRLRHPLRPRLDERNQAFDIPSLPKAVNASLQKYDVALQYGKRVTADISLMAPITLAQQRLAMKSIVQKFVNLAHGDTKWKAERLAALGLSPKMTERVLKQIRKHADTEPSRFFTGRKLRRVNFDKWMDDDAEAANAFIMATYRLGRRIIQENDVGTLPLFIHSTLGKLLFQFRTFMLGAWSKQTLHNLHMRDMETAQSFLFTSLMASVLYVAQTSINSAGRADAQEFRDERLQPEEIAKAAFQRAGWASLIPATYDTVSMLTLADKPTFAFGRSTGLASDFIKGNPTVDLLNSAARATKGLVSAPLRDDYDYSQDDFRAATNLLWFKNALGVSNVLNTLSSNLPEDSRSQ